MNPRAHARWSQSRVRAMPALGPAPKYEIRDPDRQFAGWASTWGVTERCTVGETSKRALLLPSALDDWLKEWDERRPFIPLYVDHKDDLLVGEVIDVRSVARKGLWVRAELMGGLAEDALLEWMQVEPWGLSVSVLMHDGNDTATTRTIYHGALSEVSLTREPGDRKAWVRVVAGKRVR